MPASHLSLVAADPPQLALDAPRFAAVERAVGETAPDAILEPSLAPVEIPPADGRTGPAAVAAHPVDGLGKLVQLLLEHHPVRFGENAAGANAQVALMVAEIGQLPIGPVGLDAVDLALLDALANARFQGLFLVPQIVTWPGRGGMAVRLGQERGGAHEGGGRHGGRED